MDLIGQIGEQIAAYVLETVSRKLGGIIGENLKNVQVIFSETEAAEFLKVSKQTLENYRKANFIHRETLNSIPETSLLVRIVSQQARKCFVRKEMKKSKV